MLTVCTVKKQKAGSHPTETLPLIPWRKWTLALQTGWWWYGFSFAESGLCPLHRIWSLHPPHPLRHHKHLSGANLLPPFLKAAVPGQDTKGYSWSGKCKGEKQPQCGFYDSVQSSPANCTGQKNSMIEKLQKIKTQRKVLGRNYGEARQKSVIGIYGRKPCKWLNGPNFFFRMLVITICHKLLKWCTTEKDIFNV